MTSAFEKFAMSDINASEREGLIGLQSPSPSIEQNSLMGSVNEQFPEIVGKSPVMMGVLETTRKVAAASNCSVLILGESGTGKELVASAIHRLSNRALKPFIPLNCSAIPENLLEAELFGHEKGAYTGADKKRDGVFARANGGTVFLDEIGDMPLRLQAKLLRVLQEKKFSAVGSNKTIEADVRIVAATNIDLEQAIEKGSFRLDLFYRINVLPITLPALRERGEDVVRLLEHFVVKANIDNQKLNQCYFSSEVLSVLKGYTWPGNIRELQNVVNQLVVLKDGGQITLADLPQKYLNTNSMTALIEEPSTFNAPVRTVKERFEHEISSERQPTLPVHPMADELQDFETMLLNVKLPEEGIVLTKSIESFENHLILQALQVTGNNKNQAAKLLGMNRTTLVERIKKRGLVDLKAPQKEL